MPPTHAVKTVALFALIGATVTTIASLALYLAVASTWPTPFDLELRRVLHAPQVVASAWFLSMIPGGLAGIAALNLKRSAAGPRLALVTLAGGLISMIFDAALHGGFGGAAQYFLLGAAGAALSASLEKRRQPLKVA